MTAVTAPTALDQLKALSHEIRFALVRHLAGGEYCVCDLEALLNLPQSKVSYHLGILREAKFVQAEQRGKNVYYRLVHPTLFQLGGRLLTDLFEGNDGLTHQKNSIC